MKKEDFIFYHRGKRGHGDYWFRVVGDTQRELTDKYMEMCMGEVTDVVYSVIDGSYGVRRLFPFNYDIVTPDDKELRDLLHDLAFEQHDKTELGKSEGGDEFHVG